MDYINEIASIVNDCVFEAEKNYSEQYDCCSDETNQPEFCYLPLEDKIDWIMSFVSDGDANTLLDLIVRAVISNQINTPNVFYNWGCK